MGIISEETQRKKMPDLPTETGIGVEIIEIHKKLEELKKQIDMVITDIADIKLKISKLDLSILEYVKDWIITSRLDSNLIQ